MIVSTYLKVVLRFFPFLSQAKHFSGSLQQPQTETWKTHFGQKNWNLYRNETGTCTTTDELSFTGETEKPVSEPVFSFPERRPEVETWQNWIFDFFFVFFVERVCGGRSDRARSSVGKTGFDVAGGESRRRHRQRRWRRRRRASADARSGRKKRRRRSRRERADFFEEFWTNAAVDVSLERESERARERERRKEKAAEHLRMDRQCWVSLWERVAQIRKFPGS